MVRKPSTIMQSHLLVGPTPIHGFPSSSVANGGSPSFFASPFNGNWRHPYNHHPSKRRDGWVPPPSSSFTPATGINGEQNHYTVLGVSRNASSADIKRAYRLLARKYHPDVSKDSRATEVFMTIRHAYEVLSNEVTRIRYDRALTFQEDVGRSYKGKWNHSPNFEDGVRFHRWAELKRKMQEERSRKRYKVNEGYSSFYEETDDEDEEENLLQERGSFIEVIKSAFITLFLLHTFGSRFCLTFSSLMALLDKKLDAGYKIGYVIAWVLGGRGGVLLTLCLFASWVCGKSSSSVVVLVVVAMWVGSNLARHAPLPHGALLTLLYMSIKLQVDLN